MNIKLILSKKDWLSIKIDAEVLKISNPEIFKTNSYKKKCIKRNEDVIIFKKLIISLKEIHDDNILIESKYLVKDIIKDICSRYTENKDIIFNLFLNNNVPFYYGFLDKLKDYRYSNSICNKENDVFYLDIFKHIIKMVDPLIFQEVVEYLAERYDNNEDENLIQFDFHKSLRQGDIFNNPHIEMVLWNLLQLTDIPHIFLKKIIKEAQ